jgi:hypothetical protein
MTIIKKILSLLYMWYWMIPIRLGALAFIVYFVLMYVIYGSLQPTEIKGFLESNGLNMFTGFFLPFGIPTFLSLGAMFGMAGPANAPSPTALEKAIQYRNGQMSVSSDKKAAEIFEKTAHLDVMQANINVPIMSSAVRGFDAKYGASSPTKVYNDIMNK